MSCEAVGWAEPFSIVPFIKDGEGRVAPLALCAEFSAGNDGGGPSSSSSSSSSS